MSSEPQTDHKEEILLKGIGVSPGVVTGSVFLLKTQEARVVIRPITEKEIPREIERLEEALNITREQLRGIRDKVADAVGSESAKVFDAHLMLLDDRAFIENEIIHEIRDRKINADAAVDAACAKYAEVFEQMNDDYLRERAVDVRDISRRLIRNLSGQSSESLADSCRGCLLVANDLAPSDTASLDTSIVAGFATDLGSPTSHTAIMARALEIPAVVGLHDVSVRVAAGDQMLIDGDKGVLIIHPSPARLEEYGKVTEARDHIRSELDTLKDAPAETIDGYHLLLSANIEREEDVGAVLQRGARGVGLFRTEYMYLTREDMPDEEEQVRVYENVARKLDPDPLIIRTIDLGGDKFTSHIKTPEEMNPFMGWRAIRFCLAQPEIFKVQLRAILRASKYRNVHVMYPMVCKVQEVLMANDILEEAKEELINEGHDINENLPVGVMIEIPSAALSADKLAPHVAFFSIGTNDLVQYTLAVDRVNEMIANLYEPAHPSILTLIKNTIEVGHEQGIWTGICGEMAGNPLLVPLLIGLGADELSVTPSSVPLVKDVIRKLRFSQAEQLARQAFGCETGEEVLSLCRKLTSETAPEVLELMQ